MDTVRGEVDAMAKQHQSIAAQMKTELEEPLVAFAGGMKERRKIVQSSIEKILKSKVQQTQQVNKVSFIGRIRLFTGQLLTCFRLEINMNKSVWK